jgi:hypothetical protein
MQKRIPGLIIVGVLLVGAGACSKNEPAKSTETTSAAAPAVARSEPAVTAGRTLTAEQRKAMLEKLDSRGGATHTVWFATTPNNPEAAAFQKQIQSVFEEAGWKVGGNAPVPFSLKAGVFFFMAEEEPPEYVQGIAEALEAAGIQSTAGRGYRQFYQDKKKENPNFHGFELKPDQDFILVIGRKPEEQKSEPKTED